MAEEGIDVLLVEDNEDHAFLVRKTIQSIAKDRFHVKAVADGEEAIAYIKRRGRYKDRERPDLILLDLRLPKKDGFEVLKEIKEDPRFRSIPVVVLAASGKPEDILRAYSLGAYSYIIKPDRGDALIDNVGMFLNYWLEVSDYSA